ncbi:MAG: hypothetical protein QNM00_17020 [Gammaproteobacteria bacterium]|nr:hypothetical protein [Gammaproteobacteria bacterium]
MNEPESVAALSALAHEYRLRVFRLLMRTPAPGAGGAPTTDA